MQEILNFIGQVGFPVVACIYMWKAQTKTMNFYQKTLTRQTELIESIDKRLSILEMKGENEKWQ